MGLQPLNLTQSSASASPELATPKRATMGVVLSVISGILILAEGVVRLFRGEAVAFLGSDTFRQRIFSGLRLEIIGTIAIIFAIIILFGAYLMYRPATTTAGGIIVLVFAAISIIVGGGWLIGFILGIIGGILGLLKK